MSISTIKNENWGKSSENIEIFEDDLPLKQTV
jgi:hypothetical protein